MADQDELIAQFIEISGGEESVARFYLSSSNWSLEDALSNFLGNQGDEGMSEAAGSLLEEQHTEDLAENKQSFSTEDGNFARGSSTTKPRFATLGDVAKRDLSSDDEDGQAFYTGGSDRSGQQILGPPKRKSFRDQLTDIFRMAQESNSSDSSLGPSTSSGASWGQGIRLGMTDTDHSVVLPQNKDVEAKTKPLVVIKLWSQGFSVDDGELRLYDDPQNKEFLETVLRGEVPKEISQTGMTVDVDVEDHRHEDYKKKQTTTVKTFKGPGHALGSPTPNVSENSSLSAAVASTSTILPNEDIKTNEENAKAKLKVNPTSPTTTLQIRLADGTRLATQFNLSHTIADIQEYIENARPQYANRNFILVSSFPTRELSDANATIESAGLKNAALMQRLK